MNTSNLAATIVGIKSPWRWAVPLLAASALAVLLLSGGNIPVFYRLNALFSHAPDELWTHLSLIADGLFLVLFVLPFVGRRADVVWQYVLALILGGVFVQLGKEFFSEWRPPAVLGEGSFHLIGPALQNNAFPSGHTTAAFALAGLLCLHRIPVPYKVVALTLAVLIGLSRIANGVHWPQDVLAGALGGWLVVNLAVWFSHRWRSGMRTGVQRAIALIMLALALWGVWSIPQHLGVVYPGTEWFMVLALLLSLGWAAPGLKSLFMLGK